MLKKKAISFCIYGNNPKYLIGLEENIKIINEILPDFFIFIYLGNDVDENLFNNYKNTFIRKIDLNDAELMIYRCFTLDFYPDIDISFSRDADSLINKRDIFLMNEFIKSSQSFHIIRDHYFHKNKIMGGTFGMKRTDLNFKNEYDSWKLLNNINKIGYGSDERFLREVIYDKIKNNSLIHSNIVGYLHEKITLIDIPLENEYDFIGNIIEYKNLKKEYKFKYYDFSFFEHFRFLYSQEQWLLMIILLKNFNIEPTQDMIFPLYQAYYYTANYNDCKEILKKTENITEHLIYSSNYLFRKLYKTIVATTDLTREPKQDEVVIYYGNFYHSINNLPIDNKVYRHPKYFNSLEHSIVEFDECWNKIDIIYVLNLETRPDRYLEILVELCRINAPLHKVYHYLAKKESYCEDKQVNTYYGAAKNHIDVIEHFIDKNYEFCLILEDDLTFTPRIKEHQLDLKLFFDRNYDFDVCFISASKNGTILPYDDLLTVSKQFCTTSSGYIINKKSSKKILETLKEGNELLLKTGNYNIYANDRYWQILQKENKFLIFKLKFGYQRPSYSSIIEKFNCYFD